MSPSSTIVEYEDPNINPDAIDIPNDGIDQNCDVVDASSFDGDGTDLQKM